MSWIEGFGDEVPIFFLLAVAVVVSFMVLAWKSTNVPERSTPLEEQLTFSVSADGTSEIIDDISTDGPPVESPQRQPSTSSDQQLSTNQPTPITNQPEKSHSDAKPDYQDAQQREEDTGNNIRRRILETTQAQETLVIRLKYLDDTQRTVESPISTTLAEFKRAHFIAELSANKVVKLIYNGQVLTNESHTLTQLGLDNNCVVHCLVQQARSNASAQQANHSSSFSNSNGDVPHQRGESSTAEAGVDIGGLLFPLFGLILGLVWYCRIAFATHFTATATTVLVGLSGLCVLYVFAVWHPSTATNGT